MTHALVEIVKSVTADFYGECDDDTAQEIALAVLRHPAMREPSEAMTAAIMEGCESCRRGPFWNEFHAAKWTAGCDALAREIEEASRG